MFAIYLPGRSGANPEHLKNCGLGDLVSPDDLQPSFADLLPGPDNLNGVAAHWGGVIHGFQEFDWTKSPRGDFWLGFTKDGSPTPEDFARIRQLRSRPAILDGQCWSIPVAQQLPCVLGLTAEDWAATVHQKYKPYYDACWGFWDALRATKGETTFSKLADFACLALSMNYRVNADVMSWLGVLRTDELWPVVRAAVEYDLWGGDDEPQKKSDSPSTDSGGSG